MGVVHTRHGSGTYIADGPPALDSRPLSMLASLHGFTPEQMFEARRVLEVGVAGLAAERATGDQVAAMAEEVTGMFASVEDPQTFLMHDVRFHRSVAMASGNPILASLVEMVSSLYFEQRRKSLPRGRDLRETAIIHRNIYHAVRAHDADRARREMSVHLPRPRVAPPASAEAKRQCQFRGSRVGQFIEQAPGPRGSPQRPHGAGPALDDSRPPVATAKVDSTRSRFVPAHAGQCGTSCPRTSTSACLPQSRQSYSYRGMAPVYAVSVLGAECHVPGAVLSARCLVRAKCLAPYTARSTPAPGTAPGT